MNSSIEGLDLRVHICRPIHSGKVLQEAIHLGRPDDCAVEIVLQLPLRWIGTKGVEVPFKLDCNRGMVLLFIAQVKGFQKL